MIRKLLKSTLCVVALLSCSCATAPGRDIPPNKRLIELVKEDQAARSTGNIDWSVLNAQDAKRRGEVMGLLSAGQLRTTPDYCNAALIFQHGPDQDDIRLAFSLGWLCAALLPDMTEARSLAAAAWDRILMDANRPQWYGTQYVLSNKKQWELYPVDPSVTEAERARMGVPSLSEAKERAKELNQ